MKALTLWQPMASAVLLAGKLVENRPWAPPMKMMGERFLIHAGHGWSDEHFAFCRKLWPMLEELSIEETQKLLPRGKLIGSARLVGVIEKSEFLTTRSMLAMAAGPWEEYVDHHERSPWFTGPYGWVLAGVQALKDPIECPGRQKLWNVPREILKQVSLNPQRTWSSK